MKRSGGKMCSQSKKLCSFFRGNRASRVKRASPTRDEQTDVNTKNPASQKGVGMDGSLVDEEQYPRADIDVYTVRHSRHRLICLQNDHKDLMKQIEQGLYEVHAQIKDQKKDEPVAMETASSAKVTRSAFARVDKVDGGSPASVAGIEVGDCIVEFGSVTLDNFKSLQNIAAVVQHSVGKPLVVVVLRNDREQRLSLTPQTWSGRGLLGCNIVPVK